LSLKSFKCEPEISVLIGTYNRSSLLKKVLESFCSQTLPQDKLEVIIVDDGSSDQTKETSLSFCDRLPLRYFFQKNSGISAARNLGIYECKAPIVFFQDDDDLASPNLLKEHLLTHKKFPDDNYAVLGYTNLDSKIADNPLMHFVTEVGFYLFSYPRIKNGDILGYKYFWTGRISCKINFLKKHGVFNPILKFGNEDVELGYRLSKHGLKIVYNKKAVSTMFRMISFDDFIRRVIKLGESGYKFSRIHKSGETQKWSHVLEAKENWTQIEPVYDRLVISASALDKIANKALELGLAIDRPLERLLHRSYRHAFYASKLKGITDQWKKEFGAEAQKKEDKIGSGLASNKVIPQAKHGGRIETLANNAMDSRTPLILNSTKGPDFIGIGAQKCATTFVFQMLTKHPEICFPAKPERVEIPPFEFNGRLNITWPKEIQFLKGGNEWIGWEKYLSIFNEKLPYVNYGEISPSYFSAEVERIKEYREKVPNVMLFLILRDPVERDWSAIRMFAKQKGALNKPDELIKIASSRHITDMGDYAAGLSRWLKVFPPERLKIFLYEQLVKHPEKFLRDLSCHLGIDPDYFIDMENPTVFKGPNTKITDEIHEFLIDKHRDTIAKLNEITDLDLSDWHQC